MSQTKFIETEALLAVLDDDPERLDQILVPLSLGELFDLRRALFTLSHAVDKQFWKLKSGDTIP